DDRKEHSPDTGLFYEPSAASSRANLYPNGKVSPGASLRSQKATRILPGQILADFLVKKPDDAPPEASVIETPQEPWTLFTAGGHILADFLIKKSDDAPPEALVIKTP
nr:hypothetical protein [Tanacetum cinerariifolium]